MPTFVGERRLLDGALVEDVPAAVLAACGCALRIAVQACPPMHADPRLVPRPRSAGQRRRRARSLGLRLWDFGRSHLMLCRLSAARGAAAAEVVYSATTTASNPGLLAQVPRIIAEAERSPALARAVREAEARWAELRQPAPTRVRVDPSTGEVELGRDLELALADALDPDRAPQEPSGDARGLVELLGRHAAAIPGGGLILEIDDESRRARAEALVERAGARVLVRAPGSDPGLRPPARLRLRAEASA